MFKKIDLKKSLDELEREISDFWQTERIFQRSVEEKDHDKAYFFYDGPPFATGLPHYGHLLAGIIKDAIPRYRTMLGQRVERRFGWDCHGLPVEFEVEKELKLKGGPDVEAMGIDRFNEHCRGIVLRYTRQWKSVVNRIGRWVDFENDYKTMDVDFMESIWWVCKTLWEKKLLYRSGKIVAYSARLNTPLSNFEVNLGYRDTSDPSITIRLPVIDEPDAFLLVWTTTPWTLPSNLAVTAHPELDYLLVESQGSKYYLAKEAFGQYFDDARVIAEMKGRELERKRYEPAFDRFREHEGRAFFVTLGDYVQGNTGTGLVHTAPAFGEDDFATGKKYDLPLVLPMDDSGRFDSRLPELEGLFFKDADATIIRMLKEKGLVFRHETIVHSYPFCWRSDTPLMYRWIPSWFVAVEKIKSAISRNNLSAHWKPEHIRTGRMGNWIDNAKDWAISRNRYWGTPIPIWLCSSCGHSECVGGRQELETRCGKTVEDLHRHFIDDLSWPCERCGGTMLRTPEVLDCWFESGSMPFGQQHYPFENKAEFERLFPADFISEGLDQTRGWFYTLLVISTAVFGQPAFKNCIVSGMILADDGSKMSKRHKNYPDPEKMLELYGADAIRLYLLNSGAIKAEEMRFSETGLKDSVRNVILPLLNAVNFFVTYARLDGWTPSAAEGTSPVSANPLDVWILSKFQILAGEVREAMDDYDLFRSVTPFLEFINGLTNWYIRRSRRRFWKSEAGRDKSQAYRTLHRVLTGTAKLIAPFMPFTAEMVHRAVAGENAPDSVHLCDFPVKKEEWVDRETMEAMDLAIKVTEIGRTLRASAKIKIRQPLARLRIAVPDARRRKILTRLEAVVREELNVREVVVAEEETGLISYSCRPNLPLLGPKYGRKMKVLRPLIERIGHDAIGDLLKNQGVLKLEGGEGEVFELEAGDLLIDGRSKQGLAVASEGGLTVALDTTLNPGLIEEGIVREVVNRIQQFRKRLDLPVDRRIGLSLAVSDAVQSVVRKEEALIRRETLCDELEFSPSEKDHEEFGIGEERLGLKLVPISNQKTVRDVLS